MRPKAVPSPHKRRGKAIQMMREISGEIGLTGIPVILTDEPVEVVRILRDWRHCPIKTHPRKFFFAYPKDCNVRFVEEVCLVPQNGQYQGDWKEIYRVSEFTAIGQYEYFYNCPTQVMRIYCSPNATVEDIFKALVGGDE